MYRSASTWLDFLSFGALVLGSPGGIVENRNNDSSSRRKGPDDVFADMVRNHADIWKDLISGSNNILCCPVSYSLGDDISREQLMSHVLIPERNAGTFTTLRGEHVQMVGNDLICGVGFSEQRKTRVLLISQLFSDIGTTGKSAQVTIYRLNRPLVGGINAPEDADEISQAVMLKYVAALRSFPEAEAVFVSLDDFVNEVNFVGVQSSDGFARVSPSLSASMHAQWRRSTERLVRIGALSASMGPDAGTVKAQVAQVVETYMMQAVAATVLPWVRTHHHPEHASISVGVPVSDASIAKVGRVG